MKFRVHTSRIYWKLLGVSTILLFTWTGFLPINSSCGWTFVWAGPVQNEQNDDTTFHDMSDAKTAGRGRTTDKHTGRFAIKHINQGEGDEEKERKLQERIRLCVDKHEKCGDLANNGDCQSNAQFMNVHCRRSCELCPDQAGTKVNPMLIFKKLQQGSDLGVVQTLVHESLNVKEEDTLRVINDARAYMMQIDTANKLPKELRDLCKNVHEYCTLWAVLGECDANPLYMKRHCGPVCRSCEYMSVEGRCPIDPDAPAAWEPGDLGELFTELTTDPFFVEKYKVDTLSKPSWGANYPWIITLDNVVSEEEAQRLINLGDVEGYERSSDVGVLRPDGTYESNINSGRTSRNAWCHTVCYQDPVAQRVIHRLSNITGLVEKHSEHLQLLRYEEGQYYAVHHDYVEHDIRRQSGVRILTLFLYLSDVEAGGGTHFNKLGITVKPKRGRVLLWPNVLDHNPNKKDIRTMHEALPVEKGVKYGANAWFHMYDFKTPFEEGCC